MAIATNFPEANRHLGAGDNPDTYGMPVLIATRPQVTGKMVYYVSKWQLTEDEVEEVKRTGCVYLSLMHTPVPASIHGLNPTNYKLNDKPEYQPVITPEQN